MDPSRQKLRTSDLKRWVELTANTLHETCDLLNDLNSAPIPNFNTGTNLLATWEEIAVIAAKLPSTLPPGNFFMTLAATATQYPRGSIGMFIAAALNAVSNTWQRLSAIRPADLVLAAEAVENEFRVLQGVSSAGTDLYVLSVQISDALSQLDLYTLCGVTGTALVCAQEVTVDSADSPQGIGDAGLAGCCLILAALSDVAAEAEGESPTSVYLVETMLQDWADRSRCITRSMRKTPPGGEFEVTFRHQGFAKDLESFRESLEATCSEILTFAQTDEIGLARFTTHVHTPSPLFALPHPHEGGIIISHLASDGGHAEMEEDPVEATGNVVLLSRALSRTTLQVKPYLIVLSQSPAMVESLARTGATVVLEAQSPEHIRGALGGYSSRPTVIIPSSRQGYQLAQQVVQAMSGDLDSARKLPDYLVSRGGSSQCLSHIQVAETDNQLSAAFLVEGLSELLLSGEQSLQLQVLQACTQQLLDGMRVEILDESNLKVQMENLLSFTVDQAPEIFAVISSAQPAVDRSNLQLTASLFPQLTLTTYYGGQSQPSVIGIRV